MLSTASIVELVEEMLQLSGRSELTLKVTEGNIGQDWADEATAVGREAGKKQRKARGTSGEAEERKLPCNMAASLSPFHIRLIEDCSLLHKIQVKRLAYCYGTPRLG